MRFTKLVLCDVVLISRYVKLTLHLSARSLRIRQESNELCVAPTVKIRGFDF